MADPPPRGAPHGEAPPSRLARLKAIAKVVVSLLIVGIIFFVILPRFSNPDALRAAWRRLSAIEWFVLVAIALARMPLVGWQHRAALPGLSLWRGTQGSLASTAVGNVVPGPRGSRPATACTAASASRPRTPGWRSVISGLPTTLVSLLLPVLAVVILAIYGGLTTGTLIVALVGVAAAIAGIALGAAVLRPFELAEPAAGG